MDWPMRDRKYVNASEHLSTCSGRIACRSNFFLDARLACGGSREFAATRNATRDVLITFTFLRLFTREKGKETVHLHLKRQQAYPNNYSIPRVSAGCDLVFIACLYKV